MEVGCLVDVWTEMRADEQYLSRLATVQPERMGVLNKHPDTGTWTRQDVDRVEEAGRTMNVSLINQASPFLAFHASGRCSLTP